MTKIYSSLRLAATKKLTATGGGKNQIIEVDSIIRETNCTTAWEKLLPPAQAYSHKIHIKTGVTSSIQEIVIKTKSSVPSICFGDAVFSFQSN